MPAMVSASSVTALLHGVDPFGVSALDADLLVARMQARLRLGAVAMPSIGRYRVEARIGAGGCGTVYRGFDPLLRRDVAIKVLRADGDAAPDLERVRDEAAALARLRHPNVVQIFDVADDPRRGGFVVMEWIEGMACDVWLRRARPTPERILTVFTAAAQGLAAAHDAGLVHRDVKPANILVGRDGRVRVADFGLARVAPSRVDSPTDATPGDVTTPSGAVGTPAYMAPEQWRGEPVSPRADQYAWCVSLFEALVGELPGRVSIERLPRANRRVAEALRRGLAPDPEDRFPHMHALLGAIAPPRRPARRLVLGALGLGVVTAAVLGMSVPDAMGPAEACIAEVQSWPAGVDVRDAELMAAFSKTGSRHARVAADRTAVALRGYADRWHTAWRSACEAHDDVEAAGRRRCLVRAREGFDSLVALLQAPDAEIVARAVEAAESLPAPEACDVPRHAGLEGWDPSEPATADIAARLHLRMADAAALELAGRYGDAARQSVSIVHDADAAGLQPLVVLARLKLGRELVRAGDLESGRDALAQTYFDALQHGWDVEAAQAATHLVFTVGYKLADPYEGRRWARHAEAALDRIGQQGEPRAVLESHRGTVETAAGDYAGARAYHEAALARREPAEHQHPTALAHTLNNLGNLRMFMGDFEAARALHLRALGLRRAALGPSHPMVATSMNNLASAVLMAEGSAAARGAFEETLALWEDVLGLDHPDLLSVLHNLVVITQEAGELDLQRAYALRAWAIASARFPDDHPLLAQAIADLGAVAMGEGEPERALERFHRALAMSRQVHGPSHASVADLHNDVGLALRALGRPREAAEQFAEAAAMLRDVLGPDHESVLVPQRNEGLARADLGEHEVAALLLEGVLAQASTRRISADERSEASECLARVRAAAGQGRTRG